MQEQAVIHAGPLFDFRDRVAAGELTSDPAQALLAEKLQSLHRALAGYTPSAGHAGWKERFGLTRRRAEPVQGLYIYGGVGRGKSMLMDLFFGAALVEKKRRTHFHAFLQDVHARMNAFRERSGGAGGDPIPDVAKEIADEAWLLCFDEFQVANIVDAMILGRLFENLFARDVVVVATSNRPPQDLYKDGLQRNKFVPFIEMISERLDVLELSSPIDYRLHRLKGMNVYHTPLDDGGRVTLDDYFDQLTDGRPPEPERIEVKGRTIEISMAVDGVGRADFGDLCDKPLGPADYLAIAARYHTFVVDDIPLLTPAMRDAARRFVILIDAFYEAKVNLVCSAAAPPTGLYPEGEGKFEFERLVSRLIEMQSEEYMSLPHQPGE